MAGANPDAVTVTVLVGGVINGPNCGDADGSGDAMSGANITATDALRTLRAAVGLTGCETCRCDVDLSTTITATDALAILRAAVGSPVELVCSACGTGGP